MICVPFGVTSAILLVPPGLLLQTTPSASGALPGSEACEHCTGLWRPAKLEQSIVENEMVQQ